MKRRSCLKKAHMGDTVCRKLGLGQPKADLAEWEEMVSRIHGRTKRVPIALVGKYTQLHDAYLSVIEALRHAGYTVGTHVAIRWVDSETLTEENLEEKLGGVCGILVPGGFGDRGIEGMILAAKYAREKEHPVSGTVSRHADRRHRKRAQRRAS